MNRDGRMDEIDLWKEDSEMALNDPIIPTLGELRGVIAEAGVPDAGFRYGTLWQDEVSGETIPWDCVQISPEDCERVVAGELDHLPDSTLLETIFDLREAEELDQGPPHLGPAA